MQEVSVAHGTIDTPFVVSSFVDLHDVPIRGDGHTTFTAQNVVCHFGNHSRKWLLLHIHFAGSNTDTDGTFEATLVNIGRDFHRFKQNPEGGRFISFTE